MGYDLTIRRGRRSAEHDWSLHLSVWDMSKIRDRMLSSGAAFCTAPPSDHAALAKRYSGVGLGIPAYKLSMIDDVVVHASEIRQALALIASEPESDDAVDPLWKRWVDFLELAANAGGFSVE
jgi:hypothetical protein